MFFNQCASLKELPQLQHTDGDSLALSLDTHLKHRIYKAYF